MPPVSSNRRESEIDLEVPLVAGIALGEPLRDERPGRSPAPFEKKRTFTDAAGPGPLK